MFEIKILTIKMETESQRLIKTLQSYPLYASMNDYYIRKEVGKKYHWNTFIPAFEYCTDNAGMIAITGYYKYLAGDFADLSVSASARAEW